MFGGEVSFIVFRGGGGGKGGGGGGGGWGSSERGKAKAKRSRAEQGRLAIMNVPMNFMRTNLLRYWENYFLKKPFRPVVHGECNTTTRIHNS